MIKFLITLRIRFNALLGYRTFYDPFSKSIVRFGDSRCSFSHQACRWFVDGNPTNLVGLNK